ncbi:S8 family serine peptidase [Cohnella zeiphila]|uniref:S8 family serine peptidase n=1 Tax=Cohnella zeiphila TaxID=2761120 RepID=A0A7X0SJ25_9BACL|nr:S8 family serine peptidase [Cohnella zeiphila]MBB6729689.1 S8 family serine peptidase [Cohnella zeiphila]
MRRNALIGLLFTAAVALFIVPVIAPPRTAKSPAPAPNELAVPAPVPRELAIPAPVASPRLRAEAEKMSKQRILQRDMEATELLCRSDCTLDMTRFLRDHAGIKAEDRAAHLRQAMKEHPHMLKIAWTSQGKTVQAGKPADGLEQAAAADWKQAKQALRQGKTYQSRTFKYGGKDHFVLALPDGGKPGEGVAALVTTDVVQQVERHQKRNLRLTPYPSEGRYRLESVLPNTNRDTTVKNGEDNQNASHYAVDEIVVKFQKPLTSKELLALRKELSLTVVRHRGQTYLFRSSRYKMDQLKERFAKWNPVYVEPHYLYLTHETGGTSGASSGSSATGTAGTIVPNDTLYSKYQWNLPEIATNKGWNVTRGKDDVVVAIVDTGVQSDHPDLKGRLVQGTNIIDPTQPPNDDVGHGTHVAGIIAAQVNNNEGVAGMTWYTKIMPVKALDSSGAGTTYSVAEGIIWATDHGADVINMSLGNYAEAQFLHDAVKYAYDHGVVLVAATGNDNTDRPGYPAAYPEVFAVGATNQDESRAEYSNYGDYVDVTAPGTSIASTYPGSRYAALSGTSMACPHVSALASLVRAANANLGNEDVMDLLRKTARDLGPAGKDVDFGYGQIDVDAAVRAANAEAASQQQAETPPQNLAGETGETGESFAERIRRQLERLFGTDGSQP